MRLIDADALKKRIRSAIYQSDMTTTLAVAMMEIFLEDEPTVEPKRGRWKSVKAPGGDNYPFWNCMCSECGYTTAMTQDGWVYCPHCGARNEGGCEDAERDR